MTSPRPRDRWKRQQGVTMVYVALGLTAFLAFTALAVDGGLLWAARSQLQHAVDASALAAAADMIDPTVPATRIADARTEAVEFAGHNSSVSNPMVAIDPNADVTFGNWDLDTRTFDTSVDLSDPVQVTAVRVAAQMDGSQNDQSPAFFSRVLGRTGFDVSADAIAYLGFAGGAGPGEVDLPIGVDCCKLGGPTCEADYCATIANPPNACSLTEPTSPALGQVSCIEFHPTLPQNGCWTVFDPGPTVSTPDLQDIVLNGNPIEVGAGDLVNLDNGTKTPVVKDIRDKFLGEGPWSGNPAGSDRYPPIHDPPISDSWVVKLPVVSCQTGDHCAGGAPAEIKGFVCFEIIEVIDQSIKEIRGRFLCPNNLPPEIEDVFDEKCAGGQGGGDFFGVFATQPTLVR